MPQKSKVSRVMQHKKIFNNLFPREFDANYSKHWIMLLKLYTDITMILLTINV